MQRTDRRKDGAGGRVKGVKNTLNTERSLRGIKHSSSSRNVSRTDAIHVRVRKHLTGDRRLVVGDGKNPARHLGERFPRDRKQPGSAEQRAE